MQADETFRTSPGAALVLPAILLGACALLGFALVNGRIPALFWGAWGLLALAVPFTLYINFIPTLRASNWVLKVKDDRVYLMLHNFRNAHLPDDAPVIVSFEASEIESIGQRETHISIPYPSGRTRSWKERRLEIRLKDTVPQEFLKILNAQTGWSGTGSVRQRDIPAPISCDEHAIRILWIGPHDGILPGIYQALEILGRIVPIHHGSVVDRNHPERLTDSEFDDFIRELCVSGNRIEAVMLLRQCRNWSFAEAKQFVDKLCGLEKE